MKIHGSGPPKKPSPTETSRVDPTERKSEDFSSVMSNATKGASDMKGVGAVEKVAPKSSVLPPESIREIAAGIRAGKIGKAEAADLMVRKVVEAQVGEGTSKEKFETIVERVKEVVETDPFLSKQLEDLMGMGGETG